MTLLVIAEHDTAALKPATRVAIAAAQAIGGDIHVLVTGHGTGAVATQAAACAGVTTILHADHASLAHGLAEIVSPVIVAAIQAGGYTHVLATATSFGKNVMPRVAALLDSQQISDITGVLGPDTFARPIYAGNAIATVQSGDAVKIITVRGTAFTPTPETGGAAIITPVTVTPAGVSPSRFVGQEVSASDRPELTAAKRVVSGGRGLGSADNFKIIEALADKLGAAVGASRAAVDSGYVPNDYQVGQTGKVVAPELYVAVGISGAIQHLAGMKDSKVIVAINKDSEAPIFQVADYGVVGDLFTLVPEFTSKL